MYLTMLKPNVALVLKSLNDCPDLSDVPIAEIVAKTGLCDTTVRTHIRMLAAHDYIRATRPNKRSKFSFQLLPKGIGELSQDDNR